MIEDVIKKVIRLHVNNIIQLSDEANAAETGQNWTTEESIQRFISDLGNRNTPHVVLVEYLTSLDTETLQYLEAIMYLGRDYEYEITIQYQERNMRREDFIEQNPSYSVEAYFEVILREAHMERSELVSTIGSKAPLREYFTKGCRLLEI